MYPLDEQRTYNVNMLFAESAVSSTTVPSNRNAIRPRTAPYSHWWKTTKRWLVKLMNRKQNVSTKCSQSIRLL